MSGFLKKVGQVFKKIVKSPIFKAVAIGAAIYFTGGLAIGALGGAVLPGVGALASTLGITAGSFGAAASAAVGLGGVAAGVGASGLAEMAVGGALATEGIGATIASTAASAAGTSALTSGAQSILGSTSFGQKLLLEGISTGGKALLGAMSEKSKQDAEDERYQQNREDIIRRGKVPDITNQYDFTKGPAATFKPTIIGEKPGSSMNTPAINPGGVTPGASATGYKTPGIITQAMEEDPLKIKGVA